MKTWLTVLVLAAAALVPTAVDAASLKLGKPSYGGPGCPAGTASVVMSGSTISLRFDRYQVAAGGSTGKSFDRKACSVSIPVTVPAGQAVAVVGIDYAGYNNLPAGTSSTFKVEQFLAGGRGPVFTKTVSGPTRGKFAVSSDAALSWSGCGGGVTLRTNTSLIVKASGGKAASASVRTQDVKAAIVYRLRFKAC
ncbi:MAG: DUF4360 domain-containing protein [Devosia sp.]|nr:DUF4360 domain-containing protein [Devosia sp.]